MRRQIILALLLLGLASAGGGPDDPVRWLRQTGQVQAARFELAHATYSVWRVRWTRPAADLRLTFASNARTAEEAGGLRELTVAVVRPGPLGRTDREAIVRATQQLAAHCALNVPRISDLSTRGLTAALPTNARPVCVTPGP